MDAKRDLEKVIIENIFKKCKDFCEYSAKCDVRNCHYPKKLAKGIIEPILDAGYVKFKNTDLFSVKMEGNEIIITITPREDLL